MANNHTTISRELARNSLADGDYYHLTAEERATARRRVARHHRCLSNKRLHGYAMRGLRSDWSPEQIAGRLVVDHPGETRMRVSPETVYRWIYRAAAGGGTDYRHLRRRHKKRRRQGLYGSGGRFLPGRVGIAERPAIVETRARFGDWEGDTVEGGKGKGALASLVERKSRYLVMTKLQDRNATTLTDKAIRSLQHIPKSWRQTLTLDNGREFAKFKDIERRTGIAVFFADPYAPWQRGKNENTNELIRQYLPKGCDMRKVTDKDLANIAKTINHRPRNCLGYQTPHEVRRSALTGAIGT